MVILGLKKCRLRCGNHQTLQQVHSMIGKKRKKLNFLSKILIEIISALKKNFCNFFLQKTFRISYNHIFQRVLKFWNFIYYFCEMQKFALKNKCALELAYSHFHGLIKIVFLVRAAVVLNLFMSVEHFLTRFWSILERQ